MATEIKECVHIFICTNQKEQGKCCANDNAIEIFDYLKNALANNADKLNSDLKYKAVKTSCLGRCSLGPNLYIAKDNVWYNYKSTSDIDTIIENHLINGEIAVDLLQKNKVD